MVIDDNPDDRFLIKRELDRNLSNLNIIEINNIELFHKYNNNYNFDIVITDYQLQWSDGIYILKEIKQKHPNCPVIMYTATGSEEIAVEAMKSGLEDYILKSSKHIKKLPLTIKRIINNIDKSKQLTITRKQLLESEEKYKTILSSLIDGVITINKQGIIKDINKSALELFGYTKDELLGKNILVLIPDNYHDQHKLSLFNYKQSNMGPFKGKIIEVKGLKKNNQLIDISISVSEIIIDKKILFTAIIQDIRIRKSIERKILLQSTSIQRMNRILNCIIGSMDILFYETDEKIILPKICNILTSTGGYQIAWIGYSNNCNGDNFTIEAIKNDTTAQSLMNFKNVLYRYNIDIIETVLKKGEMIIQRDIYLDKLIEKNKNIGKIPINYSSILLPLKINDLTIGVLSVYTTAENVFDTQEINFLKNFASTLSFGIKTLRNQTEIQKIQKKLAKQKIELSKLIKAVEQSPSIVIITDINGIVEYVNPKFCEITGYSHGEIVGKNINILNTEITNSLIYKDLYSKIKNKKEWRGILKNKKKNGEYFWISNSISAIVDSSGKIVNYLSVQKDITNEKMIEEQLRQSQKMEAIGRLAGGISHDYKNILTGISLCADYMLNELPKNSPLKAEVIEIKNNVKLANSITKQLLDFSKKRDTNSKVFHVFEVINETCTMLRRLLGKRYVLELNQSQENIFVNGDPVQFEQVILNLVLNAKDSMPQGGIIDLKVRKVLIDDDFNVSNLGSELIKNEFGKFVFPEMKNKNHYLLLQIKDHGIGIQENELPLLFEPFFTTKEPGKGTGLGLSTVYGIIRDWNGNISVNSIKHVGTTFSIFIPIVNNKPSINV